MKAKDVLKITGMTRTHLSRLVKPGKIGITTQPNGYYIYNALDVYNYVGNKRCNLNVIYASVSTSKQKADWAHQINLLEQCVLAQGIKIDRVFAEIASGIHFEKRQQFFTRLDWVINGPVERVFISYQDRLSRVGFGLFKQLFLKCGTEIRVANGHVNEKRDSGEIMNEIITLIHFFLAGQGLQPWPERFISTSLVV